MSSLSKTLLVVTSLCCLTSLADEPKLKGSKKEGAPKLDLGLPKFGEIPKDQKLESAKSKTDEQNGPSTPKVDEGYSVVRVKSPGKKGSSIDVVILDQRGDTVMEASGQLRFGNGVEAEWQVDWEPTAIRNPGDFQVLVRVGGNPMGTFPLKLATAETPPPAK